MLRETAPHAATMIGDAGRPMIGLPPGPRRWAAFAIGLAVFISVLDSVMVSVALPSIARDLAIDPASAIWVVNAYQLAAALVLLPLGSAADRFGHRLIYLGCLVIFMIGMIGCALSRDLVSLAACRFLQGCGGAGLIGLTNAMLRFTYPPDSLPRGIAINSFIVALTLASGPTISSLIVELANWRWLFLVGVPIGAGLLLFGGRHLPHSRGSGRGFDLGGAAISMATVGLLILAIDAQAHRQGVAIPILLLVAGLSAAIILVRHQVRAPAPIVPVDLLRTRMFGLSIGVVFGAAAAQIMAYVSLPFLFQHDLGRTQIETGLLFLPWPIALACIAPLTGRLGGRYAPGILCSIGLGIFAAGLAALATLDPGATNWDIGWRMAVCGIGYGLYQPPSSRAIIMSAPIDRAGSASTMGATGRLLGQATGAALVASLFRLLPDDARHAALLVAAAIAFAALLASAARGFRFETESFA